MKSIKLITFLLIIFTTLSCDQDNNANSTNTSVSAVNGFLVTQSGLKINEFIEEGVNKTNQFNSYLFTFNTDGTVVASNANETLNGTYLVFRDDNKTELSMTFPNNSNLFELTDDWYFVSQMGNVIRFDDSGDVIQFVEQ